MSRTQTTYYKQIYLFPRLIPGVWSGSGTFQPLHEARAGEAHILRPHA
jgi:hypothetical protein